MLYLQVILTLILVTQIIRNVQNKVNLNDMKDIGKYNDELYIKLSLACEDIRKIKNELIRLNDIKEI